MRKLLAALVLVGVSSTSWAQVLPEGSSPEAVMRALGTPRSRSATKTREIWLYPQHQVVFENGRLISLLALPADGAPDVAWKSRNGGDAAGPRDSGANAAPAVASRGASGASASTAPGSSAASSPSSASGAAIPTRPSTAAQPASREGSSSVGKAQVTIPALVTKEAGQRVLRSPEKRPAPPPAPSLGARIWRAVWPFLLSAALGALTLVVTVWRLRVRQRRRAEEKARQAEKEKAQAVAEAAHKEAVAEAEGKTPSLADWELTPELLRQIEWKRFELLVQRYYEATGHRTKPAGMGADGGVDIYLYRAGGERPHGAVQCKAWGTRRVDVKLVRELFGVAAAQRVPESAFVTTGDFTPDARVFGRQNRMALFSGAEFLLVFNRLAPMVRERIIREITDGDYTTPSCPRCGVKLVKRVNSDDASEFWGCSRYPRCHYTMKVRGGVEALAETSAAE